MCTFPGRDGDATEILTSPPDRTAGVTVIEWSSMAIATEEETDAPGSGFATATLRVSGRGSPTVTTALR